MLPARPGGKGADLCWYKINVCRFEFAVAQEPGLYLHANLYIFWFNSN